jgi:hypothetical protein
MLLKLTGVWRSRFGQCAFHARQGTLLVQHSFAGGRPVPQSHLVSKPVFWFLGLQSGRSVIPGVFRVGSRHNGGETERCG